VNDTIKTRVFYPESDFLLLIESKQEGVSAAEWAAQNRGFLKESILRYCGVIMRGFACDRHGFSATAKALEPEPIDYRGGIGPRNMVVPEVYNSTELPPKHSLAQHHEMAYNAYWPMQILFFCEEPPEEGGATTICDARRFYQSLPSSMLEKFRERGLMYVRNFTKDTPYRSIKDTFGTTDPQWINEFCQKNGVEAEWLGEDRLRLTQRAPAVREHPELGTPIFFNTLIIWHYAYWSKLLGSFDGAARSATHSEIWMNTFYGDGSPIEDSLVEEIIARYEQAEVRIAWQKSDILYFDNMLASHGRRPFAGRRKILASFRTPRHANTLATRS
jgi:alpha-ketoglutarate-dependent taurine dioxygenase